MAKYTDKRPLRCFVRAPRWALLLGTVAALASSGCAVAHDDATRVRSSPDAPVDISKLVPNYHGSTLSWSEVKSLQRRGRGQVVWVFASDVGDFAEVFDSEEQKRAWMCSPDGFRHGLKKLCPNHQVK